MVYLEDAGGWRSAIDRQVAESWGGPFIITRGVRHDARLLPGFAAVEDDEFIGYALYRIEKDACELMVLESLLQHRGVGSALIEAVLRAAGEKGCSRVWLITTNDNLHAIRFYQRFGFDLRAVHIGALDLSRKLKPQIPLWGEDELLIAHEFEFEIALPERAKVVPIAICPNAELATGLIRRAFQTVADEFALTPENCPSHPAFTTAEALVKRLSGPNCFCFALVFRNAPVGFAALVPTEEEGAYELTRLAVLPEKRRRGYGEMLLNACVEKTRNLGAARLCIGIIDENESLKRWYLAKGFAETAKKSYSSLPFTVCEMALCLSQGKEDAK
ncbi:MAG: GNAT family N-acetyltransferase [Christensenellaceae bacterium]|jgi:GNAT superfamily N-acetyltransferase|nr:GNAT family N-acetyltransferase [Christensenellaceae bacterium]